MLWRMNWKKLGTIALVVFLVYFVVKSPVESANAIRNVAGQIADFANAAASSLTTFIGALF